MSVDNIFDDLKRKGNQRMSDSQLLQKISKDLDEIKAKVNTIEERVGQLQEQVTRIEMGQAALASDVFDHRTRLMVIERKQPK